MIPPLAAWGVSGAPVALRGGHRKSVLRVGDFVFKTTRRSEAALRWLEPVQDAAHAAGLTCPRLIPSASGALLVDGWTCEPYLPGAPTNPAPISDRIARFHDLTGHLPQRPGFASARDLVTSSASADIDLTQMPAPLAQTLRTAWSRLDDADHVIVHADLNPANIHTDVEGRIILLDWDEARRDHPGFDAETPDTTLAQAKLAWEIACCWEVEPERARTLAETLTV